MPAQTRVFRKPLASAPFPDGQGGEPAEAYADPSVLFIVPRQFDATRPFDLVVYLHGFYTDIWQQYRTGDARADDKIWYGLDDQLERSGRNALLIAPQLPKDTNNGRPGKLARAGGVAALLAEAGGVLAAEFSSVPGFADRIGRAPVIVASYSGGYQAAACFVRPASGVPDRVKAVLMIDSLYGQSEAFADWIRPQPGRTVFVSLAIDSGARLNTLDPSVAVLAALGGGADQVRDLPAEPIRLGDAQVYRSPAGHFAMPVKGPPPSPLAWFLKALPELVPEEMATVDR
jgi:hypothetical protein